MPTAKRERTPIPAVTDVAKLLEGYTGRSVKAGSSEASDVSPLAIEARLQRHEPIAGIKFAFLPKKTRGESVQLRVTLHYGNQLKTSRGSSDASGFLAGLMIRGTKSLTRQQIQDLLDKEVARLGTGMNMRMLRGFGSQGLGIRITFTKSRPMRANLPAVLDIVRQVLREPTLAG